MTRQYNQLTYEQRCQISMLINSGFGQRMVANAMGVPINQQQRADREYGWEGYRHKRAQASARRRRSVAAKPSKMTPTTISNIELKLRLE